MILCYWILYYSIRFCGSRSLNIFEQNLGFQFSWWVAKQETDEETDEFIDKKMNMLHEWLIHSSFLGVAALSEKIKIIIRTKTENAFYEQRYSKIEHFSAILRIYKSIMSCVGGMNKLCWNDHHSLNFQRNYNDIWLRILVTSSFLWYYLRNLFAHLEKKIFFFLNCPFQSRTLFSPTGPRFC